ncbi:DUF2867 domain-containing protein [Gloeocapsopsis crepidinum LEGE 06123]|uniref:DUF2867 domain-containing protein n=1 Tax=Gloeocapsopsis crepidinum LEGE 06123 TaxID=588587 RepID=A0ABR9UNZ1_9CHRO|nr:DUF2867 domain-containing protein [Gloeocapsopsis crepidinum]MBE9190005.1 DUF2867 domain-containing protein [Gloeocapsopsis crepidinum LEGE 06123]
MREIVVQEIDIPNTSLAGCSLTHIDFADAFKCQLPENQPQNIDSVTRAIFLRMPQWITALLGLRNVIVRPFGLKISIDIEPSYGQDELKPGTAVGVFEVLNRRLDEIMLGEDDKHLNYRVSVQLEREEGKCWVIISTVVKFNNWLGRAYFVPIKPVHKIILPAMLRNGLENLTSNASSGT